MQIPCPSCLQVGEQYSHPICGPSTDGSELWICIYCPAVICGKPVFHSGDDSSPCYMKHIEDCHPEAYGLKKQPTKGHKKNKRSKDG